MLFRKVGFLGGRSPGRLSTRSAPASGLMLVGLLLDAALPLVGSTGRCRPVLAVTMLLVDLGLLAWSQGAELP